MNTYNNNLHASVMDSLRNQELETKSTDSKVNASVFSLYYADDAKVSAIEKHSKAKSALLEKATIKQLAVENSNASTNVLEATTHEKEYVDRAASNTAVSAANMQVAANAIIKLASDIGSIFTILGAADLNSDIYQQCQEAYEKISETAYCAEITSQHAMEASTLTAQVTAETVVERATVTNLSVTKLLKIAEEEYIKSSEIVDADNANMALASKLATKSEGILEKSHVYYLSAESAYKKSNNALNINLTVPVKNQSSNGFTVDFDFIQMPFLLTNGSDSPLYPVEAYYVMLVKETKTSIFSISNAENALQKSTKALPLCVKYPATNKAIAEGTDSCSIEIKRSNALDTDGDPIALGQNYSAFVLAVYDTAYKKNLNNFEDYLSAPSATFMLTNQLVAPQFNDAKVAVNDNTNNMCVIDNVLTFSVSGNADKNVEYRCMFLPQEKDEMKAILSKEAMEEKLVTLELSATEHKVEIEAINERYAEYMAANEVELKELREKQDINQKMVGRLRYKYSAENVAGAEVALNKLRELAIGLKGLEKELIKEQILLSAVEDEMAIISSSLDENKNENNPKVKLAKLKANIKPLHFFFNETLAAHVPVGSYVKAIPVIQKAKKGAVSTSADYSCVLEPGITDNFGNMLVNDNYYVPVVLAVSSENEQKAVQYSSALSDFNATPMFKYKAQS
ncbi:MAG: hypothetical protein COB15_10915 [Flavobacteriales bacterium]|nr:MAG: hypothetical protein COB15_10915 [Flavobacteriales bacterium]